MKRRTGEHGVPSAEESGTTTLSLRHCRPIAQRQRRLGEVVGAARVIAGSDGGLGGFAGCGALVADRVRDEPAVMHERFEALPCG